MRLYQQMIEKDISSYSEFIVNKKYRRALIFFYGAYNLACVILNYSDPLLNKKNRVWKKYTLSGGSDKKLLKKMLKFTKKDMKIISDSINFINQENDKVGDYGISILPEGKGYIGILSFEMSNL
jgi:hypothetical protein